MSSQASIRPRPCAAKPGRSWASKLVLSPVTGEKPLFVTITQTAQVAGRHTDVSLWYVLSYGTSEPLTPDPGEFREARWWTRAQINHADPALFDPHMNRMLDKLDRAHTASAGRAARPKT